MVQSNTGRLVAGMITAAVLASGCGPEEPAETAGAPGANTEAQEQEQDWEAPAPSPLSFDRQLTAYGQHGFVFEPNIMQRPLLAPLRFIEETTEDPDAEDGDDPKVKE